MNDADGGRGGDGFGFMSFPTAGAGGGAGSVPAAFGGAQPFGAAPWNPAAPLTPTGFGGAPLGDMNAGSQFNRDGALGDDEDYANEPPLLQGTSVCAHLGMRVNPADRDQQLALNSFRRWHCRARSRFQSYFGKSLRGAQCY